jgi:hypothetical protein
MGTDVMEGGHCLVNWKAILHPEPHGGFENMT